MRSSTCTGMPWRDLPERGHLEAHLRRVGIEISRQLVSDRQHDRESPPLSQRRKRGEKNQAIGIRVALSLSNSLECSCSFQEDGLLIMGPEGSFNAPDAPRVILFVIVALDRPCARFQNVSAKRQRQ